MAVEDEKKETQKEGNDTRQGRRWSNAGRRETTIEGTKGGGREDEPSEAAQDPCSFKVNYISEFTGGILGLRWTKEVMLCLVPLSVLPSPPSHSSRRLHLFLLEYSAPSPSPLEWPE